MVTQMSDKLAADISHLRESGAGTGSRPRDLPSAAGESHVIDPPGDPLRDPQMVPRLATQNPAISSYSFIDSGELGPPDKKDIELGSGLERPRRFGSSQCRVVLSRNLVQISRYASCFLLTSVTP